MFDGCPVEGNHWFRLLIELSTITRAVRAQYNRNCASALYSFIVHTCPGSPRAGAASARPAPGRASPSHPARCLACRSRSQATAAAPPQPPAAAAGPAPLSSSSRRDSCGRRRREAAAAAEGCRWRATPARASHRWPTLTSTSREAA